MIRYIRQILMLYMLGAVSSAYGMNALKPHYFPWKPLYRDIPYSLRLAFYFEEGIGPCKIYGEETNSTNAMQIYNVQQNSIAMLAGFAPDTPAGKIAIPIDYDNGVRGHFVPSATFKYNYCFAFSAKYTFPYNLSLEAYLPYYKMGLHDVCWYDLTPNVTDQDMIVRERLTNNFACNVYNLGCGLNILGWERAGLGDLVFMIEWMRPFEQAKQLLKVVDLDARAGLSFPTGLKQNEDKVLAIPFGADGAVGAIIAGGLRVTLSDALRAGFDIELDYTFFYCLIRQSPAFCIGNV